MGREKRKTPPINRGLRKSLTLRLHRSYLLMKLFHHIPSWLRNKYVLTLIGFAIWMLFVDDRDLYITWFKQRSELNALQTSKKYYEQQISDTRQELDQLK